MTFKNFDRSAIRMKIACNEGELDYTDWQIVLPSTRDLSGKADSSINEIRQEFTY